MKNTYKINYTKGTVTLTKDFADRAGIVNSEEYKILRQLKKDFPSFTILQKTVNASKTRESHKDLTFDRMAKFIRKFDTESLAKFQEVKEYYQTTDSYYVSVKSWFLNEYPDYKMTERAFDDMIKTIEEAETVRKVMNTIKAETESAEQEEEAA